MHSRADVSSFYLGNEEVAREVTRLIDAGALSSLLDILQEYGLTLGLEARREQEGLREKIGYLGEEGPEKKTKLPRKLPLYQQHAGDPLLRTKAESGPLWDPLATLRTRSRFTIVRRSGQVEEVYMPDHICPECLNELGNKIDECDRVCVNCDFRW
ncbi:MAG: hypothetical protein P1V97_20750 [Planctomycetota bacterium]|nr:hypothetical protein [Planctomycetota bacterium]